jgi:hypothetical protein
MYFGWQAALFVLLSTDSIFLQKNGTLFLHLRPGAAMA